MTAYKIMQRRDWGLISLMYGSVIGDSSVRYEVGQITKMPRNGDPLFIYEDLEKAKSELRKYSALNLGFELCLYRVQAYPVNKRKHQRFMSHFRETDFCRAVKPLELLLTAPQNTIKSSYAPKRSLQK